MKQLLNVIQIHQSPRIDEPIAMLRDLNGNGRFEETEVFTYTKDHLGSVKDITDANAELKQRYSYSAYGVTKLEKDDSHSSNQFVENPYAYTSREWEQETGCYYYRARWYCPQMEKFISEDTADLLIIDPLEFMNKYRYVKNAPINFYDPRGEFIMQVIIIWSVLDVLDQIFNNKIQPDPDPDTYPPEKRPNQRPKKEKPKPHICQQ